MASPVQSLKPEIRFFDPAVKIADPYTYAIIVSRYQGRWIWVKHKERITWELPAGHVEYGESPLEAAHRELYEETGALDYSIHPVVSYEGIYQGKPVFGMVFLAEIHEIGKMPDFEIGETGLFDGIPEELTYPEIQVAFVGYVVGEGK